MPIEHGVIKQIAYVVDDLDTAIHRWVEVVRAGPFFRIDEVRLFQALPQCLILDAYVKLPAYTAYPATVEGGAERATAR